MSVNSWVRLGGAETGGRWRNVADSGGKTPLPRTPFPLVSRARGKRGAAIAGRAPGVTGWQATPLWRTALPDNAGLGRCGTSGASRPCPRAAAPGASRCPRAYAGGRDPRYQRACSAGGPSFPVTRSGGLRAPRSRGRQRRYSLSRPAPGRQLVHNPEQGSTEPNSTLAAKIVNGLRKRRVLISASGPRGNVLKIRPPLPFATRDADRLLEELQQALSSLR
jgi:hypothetical protein